MCHAFCGYILSSLNSFFVLMVLKKICCGLIFTLWLLGDALVKCPTLLHRHHSNTQKTTLPHKTKAHTEGRIMMRSVLRLSALVSVSIGGSSSSDILKSTNLRYTEGHTRTHTTPAAVTQGQRRRFIFIMGKGAKSCWYEGGYINANCIGELLVLEKVCM